MTTNEKRYLPFHFWVLRFS